VDCYGHLTQVQWSLSPTCFVFSYFNTMHSDAKKTLLLAAVVVQLGHVVVTILLPITASTYWLSNLFYHHTQKWICNSHSLYFKLVITLPGEIFDAFLTNSSRSTCFCTTVYMAVLFGMMMQWLGLTWCYSTIKQHPLARYSHAHAFVSISFFQHGAVEVL